MEEQYKPIPSYEKYLVSNKGNVLSLAKNDGNGNRNRILKPGTRRGYKKVTLCKAGNTKELAVHRLVAEAFIPNPENKPFVNHIDNNRANNVVTNLEWVTHKENMEHSSKQGRQDECRNLGAKAQKEISQARAINKFKKILGDLFISEEIIKEHSKTRRFITYRCAICLNKYKSRADSTRLKNGGICKPCIGNHHENVKYTQPTEVST